MNGRETEIDAPMTVHEGFAYVPASCIEELHAIHALTQAAPTVRSTYLPIEANERAELTVEIANKGDLALKLLWIEFDFE